MNYGFGKINAEGNFQPVFIYSRADDRLTDQPKSYQGNESFSRVVVDLSRIRKLAPEYRELTSNDLQLPLVNGKIYLGLKAGMLIEPQIFFRLENDGQEFRPMALVGEKFCLGLRIIPRPNYSSPREVFLIRELKTVEQLLAEAGTAE